MNQQVEYAGSGFGLGVAFPRTETGRLSSARHGRGVLVLCAALVVTSCAEEDRSTGGADTGAFAFRLGDRVMTPRGRGTLRQGYASGDIVQYEIELDGANRVMVDEKDLRKR